MLHVKIRATEDQLKSLGIIDSQVLDLLTKRKCAFGVGMKRKGELYALIHPDTDQVFVALPTEYCEEVKSEGRR
jgi:hypothetical protein